jgi:hypothetical protein
VGSHPPDVTARKKAWSSPFTDQRWSIAKNVFSACAITRDVGVEVTDATAVWSGDSSINTRNLEYTGG